MEKQQVERNRSHHSSVLARSFRADDRRDRTPGTIMHKVEAKSSTHCQRRLRDLSPFALRLDPSNAVCSRVKDTGAGQRSPETVSASLVGRQRFRQRLRADTDQPNRPAVQALQYDSEHSLEFQGLAISVSLQHSAIEVVSVEQCDPRSLHPVHFTALSSDEPLWNLSRGTSDSQRTRI